MSETRSALIGLPCRNDRSVNYDRKPVYAQGVPYTRAIVEAGGTPFLIPLNLPLSSLRRLYESAAGILLTGGGDVDPLLYGGTVHSTFGDVQPDRDRDEIALARWALADNKPLMGICRGIQVIAVAAGGSLIEDVPSQIPEATFHAKPREEEPIRPDTYLAHSVALTPGSRLAAILEADTIQVNSLHHQAVRTVPQPLEVVGWSSDGLVEAIEHPDHRFVIGVQWHPEVLVAEQDSAVRIFREFVRSCHDSDSAR